MSETCIVKCPSCDNSLEFPREIAGPVTDCPVCGEKIKLEVFAEEVPKVSFFQRILERLRSFRKPTPPTEPMPDLDSPEGLHQEVVRLRQKVHELEGEVKPSRFSTYLNFINILLAYTFPFVFVGILMTYVIPIFKTIYIDLLGPGETLPELTLLVLKISDTIQHNPVLMAIVLVPICYASVWFTQFKVSSLSKDIRKLIYSVSIWGLIFLFISCGIAMFLPFIKMMDKLGQ